MKRPWFALACLTFAFMALPAQEPVDRAMVAKIRAEGLEHSRLWPMLDTLATVIGPRLTGSPAHLRAANWARDARYVDPLMSGDMPR